MLKPLSLAILSFLMAFLVTNVSSAASVCPPPSSDCKQNLVSQLCRQDSDDYRIYQFTVGNRDKQDFFFGWINDCKEDGLSGLSTAIHETTHYMTSDLHKYPLINGRNEPMAACENITAKLLKPKIMASKFDKEDGYVQTYLLGDASSADDFCFLLDEANAYGHDLNTGVHLRGHASVPDGAIQDRRAGVAAMMNFLKSYANVAQRTDAATWAAMQGPLRPAITAIWKQAAQVLRSSCGFEDWGGTYHYGMLCDPRELGAIKSLISEDIAACDPALKCLNETSGH